MVKFFINRPIFATVLALIIVVAGLVTLNVLPIAQYPDITPPTVQVSAVYPGADAQTVAQTVGLPIEQQVNGVDGMLYMSSNSSSSGAYSLTITFAVGTDIDMATVMVQNRVSIAQSSLPEAVIVQGITTKKQSSNIVMMLSLTSRDSLYDGLYLSNYASLNLTDQLARLPGVGSVSVMGAGNYSMRIWLDPEVMRIRNLTPDMVFQAISTQNRQVSAGYVGQPIAEANNPYQYTLTVKGRLTTPEEFGNIILRTEQGGKILRLKDIARIELGSSSYNVTSRLRGRQAAAIAIYQLPGSNSLEVSKAVRAKMEEIASTLPQGVEYGVTLDTTEVINASIDEVLVTFLETTALVVLVIFLFPPEFPGGNHSLPQYSCFIDRNTGCHGGIGILGQHINIIRIDPGDCHCGRRRNHCRRELVAIHGYREVYGTRSGNKSNERTRRAGYRCRIGSVGGIYPDHFYWRHLRTTLQTVRPDDCCRNRPERHQLIDIDTGTLRPVPARH